MKNFLNRLFSSKNLLAGSIASLIISFATMLWNDGFRMLIIFAVYFISLFILGSIIRWVLGQISPTECCESKDEEEESV